jgi:hypothetical protein
MEDENSIYFEGKSADPGRKVNVIAHVDLANLWAKAYV